MTTTTQKGNGKGAAELILMVGAPAAGKTTVRRERFAHLAAVDADEIKAERDGFDPKRPEVFHTWSTQEAVRRAMGLLSRQTSFVFDGTGSNVERLSMLAQVARSSGMTVRAVFVTCTLETSLGRNAARERNVPEQIVREKHAKVMESWSLVRSFCDSFEVVSND